MYKTERYFESVFCKPLLIRLILVYLSFSIGATFFSNWRFFPSVDLNVFLENWGKFFFYSIWIGLPYLFVSQIASEILKRTYKLDWTYLAESIFVTLFLLSPLTFLFGFLQSNSGSVFSFGVSEGETIKDGVVTELGKHYYFMQRMMEVFHMAIFLVLRLLLSWVLPGKLHLE